MAKRLGNYAYGQLTGQITNLFVVILVYTIILLARMRVDFLLRKVLRNSGTGKSEFLNSEFRFSLIHRIVENEKPWRGGNKFSTEI